MTRDEFIRAIGTGIVTITDEDIIKQAWGVRRTSARSVDARAYPKAITASHVLWLVWFDDIHSKKDGGQVKIVIDKKKAEARILSQITEIKDEEPQPKLQKSVVAGLLKRRLELRAAKNFAAADRIRDFLVKNGVEVNDKKINELNLV